MRRRAAGKRTRKPSLGSTRLARPRFTCLMRPVPFPDQIFEVAEGGLTDGEPMIFLFGNPTRNTGKFYRATFGLERNRWKARSIDSRECALPNKAQIEEWIHDYGEDSDFVRVRVRGLPPRASELQFIDQERVWQAQKRTVSPLDDEPLIAGVDVSGRCGLERGAVPTRPRRPQPACHSHSREHTRNDRGAFLGVLSEVSPARVLNEWR